MKEQKVGRDVAVQEFERFAEAMDLDFDESIMDDDDISNFIKTKNRVLRAIQYGDLVINEGGEAVYTPTNAKSKITEPITFHERTGAAVMAMDGKKKGHDVAKTYAVMADMCRVPPKVFAGLVGIDGKVCEAVFTLLMD